MSFAPPVSSGGFHYNGDLYVEVGNLNRHKRASIAEITNLLRPTLKKGNKIPEKDAFGHWYEAQLIHYGLPPSKDKARAKMRLLEALNASKLLVPPEITRLEDSLRKEYDVAERKAKALYKTSMATSAEKPGSSKKRKQSDGTNYGTTSNATTVNVNVNFGAFNGIPFGAGPNGGFPTGSFTQQQDSEPPKKKARTSVAKVPTEKPLAIQAKNSPGKTNPKIKVTPTKGSTKAEVTTKDTPVKKQTAIKSKPAIKEPATESQTAFKTKQTARKSTPAIKKQTAIRSKPATEEPATIKQTAFKTKQTARKSTPTIKKQTAIRSKPAIEEPATMKQTAVKTKQTATKSKPAIKKESTIKKEANIKEEPGIKTEPGGYNQPALGLINGLYEISCPSLESTFDCDGGTFSLILCLDTPRVWGNYYFGPFNGIWHLPQRPYQPSENPLPFHWRGRKNGESGMCFGEDCFGEIAFLGDGRIAGMLNLLGDCAFTGMRRPGPTMAPRPANSMREEWEGYNEDNRVREDLDGYDEDISMRDESEAYNEDNSVRQDSERYDEDSSEEERTEQWAGW